MSLSLVQQETFQGVGTLNNGTPGNLGTVPTNSAFLKRAVGPRLSSDTTANSLGWSADLTQGSGNSATCEHSVACGAAVSNGLWSAYYWIERLITSGVNSGFLFKAQNSSNLRFLEVYFIPGTNGNFFYNPVSGQVDSGVAIPIRQWFELRLYWRLISGTTYSLDVAYRLCGGSSWTTIFTNTNKNVTRNIDHVVSGLANTLVAASSTINARYGLPSLYSATADADSRAAVSGIVDPPALPITWYLDTATGSDTNDGVTSSSAWLTAAKLTAESAFCGFFAASTYGAGDTLNIKAPSATPLPIGEVGLTFNTQGLNVQKDASQSYWYTQMWAAVANASFTKTAGKTNIYQQTLSHTVQAQKNVVLWEDQGSGPLWLNHPKLNDYANIGALLTAMDSVPGSFYVDSSVSPCVLYLVPFGNTNPTSDGKTYTRSYNRGGVSGNGANSAVNMNGANMHVSGMYSSRTCMAQNTDNDALGAYALASAGSWGGVCLVENCYLEYGAKHLLGLVDSASGTTVTVNNVQVEQGSPYASQTPFVSFNGGVGSGTVHHYINCTNNRPAGLIGSTAGSTAVQDTFLSHNNSGSGQFQTIDFTDCNFTGSIGATNAVTTLNVLRTSYGGSQLNGATTYNVDQCRITGEMPTASSTTTLTVTNSWVNFTVVFNSGFDNARAVQGTVTYKGCTIDLRNVPSGDEFEAGVYKRKAASNITVRNCVFILSSSQTWTIFQAFVNTDTLAIDHNEYVLGSGNLLHRNYNDGTTIADRTLAQATSLGIDTASNQLAIGALTLNLTTYVRTGPASLQNDLGSMADLTGTVFAHRKTPGAYEFSGGLLMKRRRAG